MTDMEIIKALECCVYPKVGVKCPRNKYVDICHEGCKNILLTQVFDLVNRQQAELIELQKRVGDNR